MPSKYQTKRTVFVRQRDAQIKQTEQNLFSYKPKDKKK